MDDRDKAIQLIKMKGPVVPSNISKELGKNILFTSVILAELVSSKRLKVSTLKIGSSPLYYIPGQESRLELFYKYLNEKDIRTFNLLREKKVMREKDQNPLIKVSLAMIKDFAIPITVTINGEKELFYKWHSLSNEEVSKQIKKIISPETIPKPQENIPEVKTEIKKPEVNQAEKQIKPTGTKEEEPKAEMEKRNEVQTPKPKETEQKTLTDEPDDPIFQSLKEFFRKNNITLKSSETIRKGKVYDCEIRIRTSFGDLPYYCRFKDKKRISDSDIASAFVQAQMKKLPLLFLTTGEPTKKSKEMLKKEFESVTFVEI